MVGAIISIVLHCGIAVLSPNSLRIWFQAHRGGLEEVPENTLPALEHAWNIPGAVPEVDLRTTGDGVIVCMHDETPGRTTNAPDPWATMNVKDIPYTILSAWDAGVKFSETYRGTKIPTLVEVLGLMKQSDIRHLYLDIKDADAETIRDMIIERGLTDRIIFVHGDPQVCIKLSMLYPGTRTMTWIGGTPAQIQQRFQGLEKTDFTGISQLQIHLHGRKEADEIVFLLPQDFIIHALGRLDQHGVTLQLRPFLYDSCALQSLLTLGIKWFVTDAPRAFYHALQDAQGQEERDAR